MFCDRCGTQLSGSQAFCPSCGKPIHPVPARAAVGRIEGHVKMLGIFWMIYSAFRLMGGWFIAHVFPRFGAFWSPHIPLFLAGLLRGLGMVLLATGVLGMIAGWGLIERQPWARTLAIVLGVLTLFQFGLGTVLGVYTLWVLLPAESAAEYQRTARAA